VSRNADAGADTRTGDALATGGLEVHAGADTGTDAGAVTDADTGTGAGAGA
jgi:hypothetical protein